MSDRQPILRLGCSWGEASIRSSQRFSLESGVCEIALNREGDSFNICLDRPDGSGLFVPAKGELRLTAKNPTFLDLVDSEIEVFPPTDLVVGNGVCSLMFYFGEGNHLYVN